VALVGERFDGHGYVAEAMRRGAAAALTARETQADFPVSQVIVEGDTKAALGRLAGHWRRKFSLPVVALTGSNGKTTVKEMLAAMLAAYCGGPDTVLATEGNLNNDIGMPLTLLRLRDPHRFAVIEMGMNHAGEIDYLTRIAEPTVAIVNNAHRAHVGMLGSVEAIARAKGEIYAGLRPGGIAVVNADDRFADYWKGLNPGRRVVTFGLDRPADVRATREGNQVRFVTPADAFAVTLQVSGEHNVRNALAACAAAHALEIPPEAMQEGLRHFTGVPGRLQRRRAGGGWVIDDTYNANPDSMKAAVQVLGHGRAGRRRRGDACRGGSLRARPGAGRLPHAGHRQPRGERGLRRQCHAPHRARSTGRGGARGDPTRRHGPGEGIAIHADGAGRRRARDERRRRCCMSSRSG
jgi:UDP-N-acetylmuramoyl-tripeptide--D-alanyl-D-alanine ligase